MTWLLMSFACSRAPIEDRWSHGSITQIKDVFTSAFVLETSDGWIVIDTGFNAESKPIANFLEEQSASLTDIQTMLFTHGHTDHIGGYENFPNATFHVHENDKSMLTEIGASNIETFTEGAEFTFGDSTIRVFEVPGHTEGNVAMLVDDVLLMGDSAMSTKKGEVLPTDSKYTENTEMAESSLKALPAKLEPYRENIAWVVFSHSGPIEGADALFELAE